MPDAACVEKDPWSSRVGPPTRFAVHRVAKIMTRQRRRSKDSLFADVIRRVCPVDGYRFAPLTTSYRIPLQQFILFKRQDNPNGEVRVANCEGGRRTFWDLE